MAENILKLKKRAVAAGMAKSDAMKADRKTLTDFIEGGSVSTKPKKKAAVAKKKTATATAKPERKKSGRKPAARGATAKKTAAKKSSTRKQAASENADHGRLGIGSLDWTAESDDWNPKKGGPVEKLFKALKSAKGDIDRAYAKVAADPYAFVGKKKRDGSKRTKAEVETMLRYRLNRTKFEFAKRTGQHESASPKNRAAYGTGVYATVRKVKPPRKNAKKATTTKPKSTKKTGRKKSGRK